MKKGIFLTVLILIGLGEPAFAVAIPCVFGIGVPELIVIGGLLFLLIFPIWLSLFLRKRRPGKVWIGLILAFWTFWGQLYVKGAAPWIFLLAACDGVGMALAQGRGSVMVFVWLFSSGLSVLIMYYRLRKAQTVQEPKMEIGTSGIDPRSELATASENLREAERNLAAATELIEDLPEERE